MRLLSPDEMHRLLPAETHAFRGPVPTQIVSSEEYFPTPQTAAQREVEARLKALGDELGARQGLTRRAFFRTAAGMAAAYVAMNEVYGPLFAVTRAEAADKDLAAERAKALAGQFIMDTHTHFLKDDTRLTGFVRMREAVGRAGWNPGLAGQAADHRGSKIRQLLQGDLPRQRYQGGADQQRALRRAEPTGSSPTR